MSFLDRIRNNDDQEVELNPSNVHDGGMAREPESDEVELQDDSEQDSSTGKGFLPGMGDQSRGSTASTGNSRSAEKSDRLEKIMEQNERIIELLEEIAGTNERSNPGNDSEELW
ncbi:MAG: hypothetical protein SV186_05315 [Candidatus Nanohaloarchaea archaeon]|nr:hypothetical protein [Candidatus Nanohaloarchaea archaeon]